MINLVHPQWHRVFTVRGYIRQATYSTPTVLNRRILNGGI